MFIFNENTPSESQESADAQPVAPIQEAVTVEFELIHDAAELPQQNPHSSALNLKVCYFEKKNFSMLAHTGLKMKLPVGYEAEVRSLFNLALDGCVVVDAPGTIGSDFDGEVCVILGSTTGQAPFMPEANNRTAKIGNAELTVGDVVAKLVIQPSLSVKVKEV